MRTGTWRGRTVAGSAVLAWHALLGWTLVRALGTQQTGIDVVPPMLARFIVVTSPSTRAAHAQRRTPVAAHPAHRSQTPRMQQAASQPILSVVAAHAPLPDLAAQVRAQAQQAAPIDFSRRDPLAERVVAYPTGGEARFRMAPPRSPARVVALIGSLFYPPGQGRDPCPRNRDNIGQLMAAGDSAALQQELDMERRNCRP